MKEIKYSDFNKKGVDCMNIITDIHMPAFIKKYKKNVFKDDDLFSLLTCLFGTKRMIDIAILFNKENNTKHTLFYFLDNMCKDDNEIREVWNGTDKNVGFSEFIEFYNLKGDFFTIKGKKLNIVPNF